MNPEHSHRRLPPPPDKSRGRSPQPPERAGSPDRRSSHAVARGRPTVDDLQPYIDAMVNSVSERVGPQSALTISIKVLGAEIKVEGTPMTATQMVPTQLVSSLGPPQAAAGAAQPTPPKSNLRSKQEDIDSIKHCLLNSPELPITHSFFLSHVQREAGDVSMLFSLLLHAEAEMPCWHDQSASTINLKTMVHGIAQAAVFIVTLTKSYFESRYCVFELRAARYLKKRIVMVHETDERQAGYAPFGDFWRNAPPDLADLCDIITSRPIRRKGYEQEALVQDIIREVRPQLNQAENAKKPLQILGKEVTEVLRKLGETAACYVDLGSGQTMVYLLAIADDLSLDYQLVWEHKECFLDMPDQAREQVRPIAVAKFASIVGRLQELETPPENLFQVCVGATATYRVAAESGAEGKARVDTVESWFRAVIADAKVIAENRVTFETLVPRDEAMFEWLAVKTACTEVFGFPCDAVIAGGSGSVQVSMENEFMSGTSNLKAAAAHVEQHGAASYKASLMPMVRDTFGKIGERLQLTPRSEDRPLRLVLISSFYYAAVACKVVQKGDFPRYREVAEFLQPARAMVDGFGQPESTAKAKDVANLSRLLSMIDIVTSGDFNNVEVLIVREWTVRHKEYKATWTTGKFLHDARLKVLRSRKMSAGQESE